MTHPQSLPVIVRPWQKEDAPGLAYISNNRNIWNNVRDALPFPYTLTDAQQWIQLCATQTPARNFAVEYKGEVAGSIGCVPGEDIYRKSMEIGYFIGEPFWGKGIATEAVRQLLQHISENFSMSRLFAGVFAYNTASMRVLQKNGFYLESVRRQSIYKNNQLHDEYVWVKLLQPW
ncbi:GNAT family N-acetyltransferase [Deminuibacter soli]|uniref:N-acetyltransferase n=1 Tax=Deminuibacter soli TaxID=2291815 RepID=A0A3E1NR27_9BACT|nr:GNAT family protein [Deminuibacter soli]RFM30360.1 N-acetyltransferase [Deminuibacter soli]